VKSYLDDLVDEHFDDAEHCDFYLKYGSTVLEISIDPYEEDDAVIEVLAFCVQGVEPSFETTTRSWNAVWGWCSRSVASMCWSSVRTRPCS